MSPRIINREKKHRDILIAAIKVFARQGVANTKMIDIAREAGIGKGTIYEYFKSKDDIFYKSFHYFMEQTNSTVNSRIRGIHDPVLKLEAWIDGWLAAMTDSIDLVAIMMDYWAEGIRLKNTDSIFNLRIIYDKYRETIKNMLDEGISKGKFKPVNTNLIASILIGTLDGLGLQLIMDRNLFKPSEAALALKDSFIKGLLKEDELKI
jgi:AcrR family transcriptional regulator